MAIQNDSYNKFFGWQGSGSTPVTAVGSRPQAQDIITATFDPQGVAHQKYAADQAAAEQAKKNTATYAQQATTPALSSKETYDAAKATWDAAAQKMRDSAIAPARTVSWSSTPKAGGFEGWYQGKGVTDAQYQALSNKDKRSLNQQYRGLTRSGSFGAGPTTSSSSSSSASVTQPTWSPESVAEYNAALEAFNQAHAAYGSTIGGVQPLATRQAYATPEESLAAATGGKYNAVPAGTTTQLVPGSIGGFEFVTGTPGSPDYSRSYEYKMTPNQIMKVAGANSEQYMQNVPLGTSSTVLTPTGYVHKPAGSTEWTPMSTGASKEFVKGTGGSLYGGQGRRR